MDASKTAVFILIISKSRLHILFIGDTSCLFFQHLRTRTKKFQFMSVYFMSVLHGSCLVVVLPASSLNLNNGPSFLCQCQKHVHVSSFFVCLSVSVISQSPGILAQSSSTHIRTVVGMCVFVPFHCSGSHYSIPRHEQGHKDVQAP